MNRIQILKKYLLLFFMLESWTWKKFAEQILNFISIFNIQNKL